MMKEKKPLDIVKDVKSTLSAYRKNFEKNWKDEQDAYYGKIWQNVPEFRPYENFCFQIIETQVPILTDSYPGIAVKTKKPELLNQVSVLQESIDYVLNRQNFQLKLPIVVRNSLIAAPAYLYPYYDANENNGEGEIKIDILKWENVWLSGESDFIDDCSKARFEVYKSKEWLKLNYKKFVNEIENAKPSESTDYHREGQSEKYDIGEYSKRSTPTRYKDESLLKLVKTYIKDYSIVAIPEEETLKDLEKEAEELNQGISPDINLYEDHKKHIEFHTNEIAQIFMEIGVPIEAGKEALELAIEQIALENPESGIEEVLFKVELLEKHIEEHKILLEENPKSGKLKYKNGFRLIETLEDKTVLYDGSIQDEHYQIPLVPFYAYKDDTIYGFGELRNLLDSQRMQAELQYKEYKGLRKVANPGMIADEETGLTEDDITNEDGAIYVIPQGTNIRHLSPGAVSPQVGQFVNDRIERMMAISGVNEATQGKMPSPNAAALTVERLNQQAIGRLRLKDRINQRYSVKRLGNLVCSLILQYWTNDKVISFADNEEKQQVIFNPLDMQDLDYEVEVSEGSMTGIDKDALNVMMLNFLNAGQINFKEFLEVADFPKVKKLKSMINERENIEAQMQELQQQNVLLKGQLDPSSLTPEEAELFAQLQSEAQLAPNQGQA